MTVTGPSPSPVRPANTTGAGTSTPAGAGASGTTGTTEPTEPTTPPAPQDSYSPAQVRQAERLLKNIGFRPGNVDGTYTNYTGRALNEFQASMGLTTDGRITSATVNKLKAVSARVNAARRDESGLIGRGQKHQNIQDVEARLRRLGYDTGRVDGVFDGKTARAVQAFKRDQDISSTSGLIGKNGRKILKTEVERLAHAPRRARVKPSAERRADDRRVKDAADNVHTVRNAQGDSVQVRGLGRDTHGDRRVSSVAVAQRHLRAAGYDAKRTDGRFDDRTEGMVREFQRKSGLPVSGRIDTRTWNQLQKATLEARSGTSPAQRIGERSSAVRQTERLLKELGHNTGAVDGLYTQQTQRALDSFRRKHDVGGRGSGVGPNTLRALKRVVERERDPLHGLRRINETAYVNGSPRSIKVVRIEGELVEVTTARRYLKMKDAAKRDGVDLRLVSGFRTMAEQRYLYDGWINRRPGFNPAAPPGYSNHQNGIALDLNTLGTSQSQGTGAVYNWLARNGRRFGFERIPLEHWHWERKR